MTPPTPFFFLFNDFIEIITKLKMGHLGGCGVRLGSTNFHLLFLTCNPFYGRLMLLSWVLLLAKSLSSYFQLISEALKYSHGLDLGATQALFWLYHPSPGSQDHCAFVYLLQIHVPHPGY